MGRPQLCLLGCDTTLANLQSMRQIFAVEINVQPDVAEWCSRTRRPLRGGCRCFDKDDALKASTQIY